MTSNGSKTLFTEFSHSYLAHLPVPTKFGNLLVKYSTTKFLGILHDNRLKFAPHLRDVCKKLSRGIGVCKQTYPNNYKRFFAQTIVCHLTSLV